MHESSTSFEGRHGRRAHARVGMFDSARTTELLHAKQEGHLAAARTGRRLLHIALPSIAAVVLVSALCIGARNIAPLVESDYCYLLTAADRFHQGLGLTTTPPVAPLQTWEWQGDWTFLTKWPVGYPILITAIRTVFGCTSLQAAGWISTTCALASLLGWCMLARRVTPGGFTSLLLASLIAGSTISIDLLTNPSTDFILTAALPWLMLALSLENSPNAQPSLLRHAAVGFAAGGLFWIRYASISVPMAFGGYLLIQWRRRHRTMSELVAYGCGALLPIIALLLINRTYGGQDLTPAQLNLGSTMEFSFSWSLFSQAWLQFTNLGFYDYHWFSKWLFALWPPVLLVASLFLPSAKARVVLSDATLLSAIIVLATLGMLIAATTLFGSKFHYVSLERYYQPIRALYLIMFIAPLLHWRNGLARAGMSLCMLLAISWIVQQEWTRPLSKTTTLQLPSTPYGAREVCFNPDANKLYSWLATQNTEGVVVVSNFHEFIELETGIPALPIPQNQMTLDRWLTHIRTVRRVQHLRVLFVLDPDNKWRDYWIEDPEIVEARFNLAQIAESFPGARVFEYAPASTLAISDLNSSRRSE